MTNKPAYSSIVASFGWPYSVSQLVDGYKVMGYSITPAELESTWDRAKANGDLPPLERPDEGFDHRQSALLFALTGRVGEPKHMEAL